MMSIRPAKTGDADLYQALADLTQPRAKRYEGRFGYHRCGEPNEGRDGQPRLAARLHHRSTNFNTQLDEFEQITPVCRGAASLSGQQTVDKDTHFAVIVDGIWRRPSIPSVLMFAPILLRALDDAYKFGDTHRR